MKIVQEPQESGQWRGALVGLIAFVLLAFSPYLSLLSWFQHSP